MKFVEKSIEELTLNPFTTIGKEWMLVGAENDGKANAMTASWGGLGVMWGKNVAYVVIRQSRFTKTLVDASESFSLSVFDHAKYADMLGYMGKASGRNEDKIAKANLTVLHKDDVPYFGEAKMVLICKKLCEQVIEKSSFLDASIAPTFYADNDMHSLYIAEICNVLVSKN